MKLLKSATPNFCLVLLLLTFLISQHVNSAEKNSINVEKEMEFKAYEAVHWQTPVSTYNNNIYFVWVDNQMRTMVAKKTPNGKITTSVIHKNGVRGKNHNLPSLGIDKEGYIHIAYNMHHSLRKEGDRGWQYKVSNKPGDISSFTYVGKSSRTIPGKLITYPSFTRDNRGNLYVTFRHRTHRNEKYGVDGSQGIGIAKYNSATKRWAMLGGTNYEHGVKTFFWSDSSMRENNKSTGYQGYRAKIFFDNSNRMHISWDVFIAPGREASHIMYAYSDDGGNTFKRANGSKINSLPITPQNGDVVERASRGIYNTRTYVAVTKSGNPIVAFEDRSKGNGVSYFKVWNGSKWSNKKSFPANSPSILTVNSDGVLIAVGNGKLHKSWDNGNSWKSYALSVKAESTTLDDAFLKQTDQIRFQTHIGNSIKIYTASFSNEQNSSLSPPTKLKLLQSKK